MLVLCHKCAGVLSAVEDSTDGLYGCRCISGYVREWYTSVTKSEAEIRQRVAKLERAQLKARQREQRINRAWDSLIKAIEDSIQDERIQRSSAHPTRNEALAEMRRDREDRGEHPYDLVQEDGWWFLTIWD